MTQDASERQEALSAIVASSHTRNPKPKGRRDLAKQGSSSEARRPPREGKTTRVSCDTQGIPAARFPSAATRAGHLRGIVEARAEDAREAIFAMMVNLSYGLRVKGQPHDLDRMAAARWLFDEVLALADQVRTPHEKRPYPEDAMEST